MDLLTKAEGLQAIRLARTTLEAELSGKKAEKPDLPGVFGKERGIFVTLKRHGQLRGCIGFPYPVMPLAGALQSAAVAAALEDPRFPPVTARELPSIEIEVTVLTPPGPLECLPDERPAHVEVGRHGLIIVSKRGSGLLLPQVATENGWNTEEFLDHTCLKAGLPVGCWRSPQVQLMLFEGQIFSENE